MKVTNEELYEALETADTYYTNAKDQSGYDGKLDDGGLSMYLYAKELFLAGMEWSKAGKPPEFLKKFLDQIKEKKELKSSEYEEYIRLKNKYEVKR